MESGSPQWIKYLNFEYAYWLLSNSLQLDNEPCPDAQVRHVETQVSECGRFPDIPCTNAVIYMFESFPAQVAHPYKSKFCEMGVDPIFADCYDGKMRYNFAHNCGIGLILKPQIKWRHVLPDNDVVEVWILFHSVCGTKHPN